MRLLWAISALALVVGLSTTALAAEKPADKANPAEAAKIAPGARIDYKAVAGTLVVHPKGWDDVVKPKADDEAPAEASMFYTAYFKKGAPAADRPILFVFNGGPGSSTVWLHMGAFGPRRVVTADGSHTPPAPYKVVDNGESPLDVADLVFIDAPGAGFSRIAGKDKEKAFYGIDQDVYAFAEFIKQFLSKHQRWNSPRYLFGESYGTPRAVALAARLQNADSVDLNGIMLLSVTLAFDFWADAPQWNPGNDLPYIVTLPTYAATAWYHNRVPGGRPAALIEGNDLPTERKQAMAEKLARYTGLTPAYILRANLRVNLGQFNRNLMDESGQTLGRLDTRFTGPSLDVLSREGEYDPQSTAISSAYVSAFNDYARGTLRYGAGKAFKLFANVGDWDLKHTPPDASGPVEGAANVLPDLAFALKTNPSLRVLVLGGYYDTATPYFEGRFQMRHLPVPEGLQGNISYKYYPSGHMVYAHEESLKALHDDVAAFVKGR